MKIFLILTTKCWKSHDRITLVACFGRTPRFCFRLLECVPELARLVKSLSQSSAEPPGVVGAGDNWPDNKLLSDGNGQTLTPIWPKGVLPCTIWLSYIGWGGTVLGGLWLLAMAAYTLGLCPWATGGNGFGGILIKPVDGGKCILLSFDEFECTKTGWSLAYGGSVKSLEGVGII